MARHVSLIMCTMNENNGLNFANGEKIANFTKINPSKITHYMVLYHWWLSRAWGDHPASNKQEFSMLYRLCGGLLRLAPIILGLWNYYSWLLVMDMNYHRMTLTMDMPYCRIEPLEPYWAMVNNCCVVGCNSNYVGIKVSLRFFSFPLKDKRRCKLVIGEEDGS